MRQTENVGAIYRAAGGQTLTNKVEQGINCSLVKHVEQGISGYWKYPETNGLGCNNYGKGNQIVSKDPEGQFYIHNHASGTRVPLQKASRVYVVHVEYLAKGEPFQRPVESSPTRVGGVLTIVSPMLQLRRWDMVFGET